MVEHFNYAPLDWDRMNAALFFEDADGPVDDERGAADGAEIIVVEEVGPEGDAANPEADDADAANEDDEDDSSEVSDEVWGYMFCTFTVV